MWSDFFALFQVWRTSWAPPWIPYCIQVCSSPLFHAKIHGILFVFMWKFSSFLTVMSKRFRRAFRDKLCRNPSCCLCLCCSEVVIIGGVSASAGAGGPARVRVDSQSTTTRQRLLTYRNNLNLASSLHRPVREVSYCPGLCSMPNLLSFSIQTEELKSWTWLYCGIHVSCPCSSAPEHYFQTRSNRRGQRERVGWGEKGPCILMATFTFPDAKPTFFRTKANICAMEELME